MAYRTKRSGDISIVAWNLSGVVLPDRATTYLAEGSGGDARYFRQRFISECGKEGPMKDINPDNFAFYLRRWERKNERSTDTRGRLGAAVTDMRHNPEYSEAGITKEQTKYIKNALLDGISMKEVNRTMGNRKIVPLNPGFEAAVERLHKEGIRQVIFSNTTHPVVEFFKETYGMEHAEGLPVIVRMGNKELPYTSEMYGSPDVFFTGRLDDAGWDKAEQFFNYLRTERIPLEHTAAIDEDDFMMLEKLKLGGGLAVGYKVRDKYRKTFLERGISILKGDDLRGFAEIVVNPELVDK